MVVPGLLVVCVALFALLFLYAVKLFAQALAAIIPRGLPLIGDSLHNIIAAAATLGSVAVEAIMGGLIRPMINFILGPVYSFLNWMRDIEHFAGSVTSELLWLVEHGVTDAVAWAGRLARSLFHAAEVYAVALVHHLAAALLHDIALVKTYATNLAHAWAVRLTNLINLARVYAHALVHTLAIDVLHDIALARSYALSLTNHLAVDVTRDLAKIGARIDGITAASVGLIDAGITKAITVSEAYTLGQIGQVIHLVDVDGVRELAAAWPGVIDDVDALVGVVSTDLPDIAAALRSIPRAVPTDLTGALAAAGALAIPAIRYMRECGVPNCRNLSKYGRDLAELSNLFGAGALIALLAELVTDPEGAARDTVGVLGTVLGDAVGAARDLVGR